MKAMTLWQPWASMIAEGIKTIETRGREHPWRSAAVSPLPETEQ